MFVPNASAKPRMSRHAARRAGDDDDAMQRFTSANAARYVRRPAISLTSRRNAAIVRPSISAARQSSIDRPVVALTSAITSSNRLPVNVCSDASNVIGVPSSVTMSASTAFASVSLSAITPSKSNTMILFNGAFRRSNTFVTQPIHLYITVENGWRGRACAIVGPLNGGASHGARPADLRYASQPDEASFRAELGAAARLDSAPERRSRNPYGRPYGGRRRSRGRHARRRGADALARHAISRRSGQSRRRRGRQPASTGKR